MRLRELTTTLERLEGTRSRGQMVRVLADLLGKAAPAEIEAVVYLVQGQARPVFEGVRFGAGEKLLIDALARTYGVSDAKVRERFRESGDLGLVAESLAGGRRPDRIAVRDAHRALLELAGVSGKGSRERKIDRLSTLLRDVGALDARYLVRVVQGRLRVGAGDQTILEAIAVGALGSTARRPAVERAYNLRSDLGWVARAAYESGEAALRRVRPRVGIPIRPALAQRASSVAEITARTRTMLVEPKYDGFRLQLHRDGNTVRAFSRRLDEVTGMFPEISTGLLAKLGAESAILEGEAVVYNPETGEFLPFQLTMTRKRKHRVAETAERHPIRFFAFDLLFADGRSLVEQPLAERRRRLLRLLPGNATDTVTVTEAARVTSASALQDRFDDAVHRGLEGVIVKRPDAPYHAGSRNYNWIKLKRGQTAHLGDTVDVVVVGYLVGKGKRADLGIGSLLAAVYDPVGDRFRTVAKVGSGASDADWRRLRTRFDERASRERPRRVDSVLVPDVWTEPAHVVVVLAEEITRSPLHTCGKRGREPGYALRFPRLVGGIREDKAPEDATTEEEILDMFRRQGVPPRAAAAD